MKNTIIYILGHSGSGKYSIGTEIAKLQNFKLIDNHYINNVIFQLIETDGKSKLPEKVWEFTRSVRKAVFGTIKELSSIESNFIFTNALMKEQEISEPIYQDILEIVKKRKAIFFAIVLDISKNELKNRISNPERREKYKDISPENAEKAFNNFHVFEPNYKNTFHINVDNKTAKEAAIEILEKISLTIASTG